MAEFGDDATLRGLNTESPDDGLLPSRVGSRLDEESFHFLLGGADLSVNVDGRRLHFGRSESGWKLAFQSGKYLIRRELRRQRWCRPAKLARVKMARDILEKPTAAQAACAEPVWTEARLHQPSSPRVTDLSAVPNA